MSRVTGAKPSVKLTRKQRADALLATASTGPSFSFNAHEFGLSESQLAAINDKLATSYALWSATWLLPELKKLVPELSKK